MKIKDLNGQQLDGLKVKTPKGVVGYWKSQWIKGVWLSDGKTDQIYPQFVDNLKDCLDWEVTDDEVNCNIKTSLDEIDNYKKDEKT